MVVVDEGAGRLRMEADQGEAAGIPVVMVSKQDGEREATTRPVFAFVTAVSRNSKYLTGLFIS